MYCTEGVMQPEPELLHSLMHILELEVYSVFVLWLKQLVDLPCIVESLKTTDHKNFFKTADICQVCDRLVWKTESWFSFGFWNPT